MIYPPHKHISSKIARAMVLELYSLDNIESWHVYNFAEKYGFVVNTKEDIKKIAKDKGLRIKTMLARHNQNKLKNHE